MLTIILTSYNRPFFVGRAIESLKRQTCDDWLCHLLDDNSNFETKQVIHEATKDEPRFIVRWHMTTDEQRKEKTRYAVLINGVLPTIKGGIVGYMCDNVEYDSQMVGAVLNHFEKNPDHFAGYVYHRRDVYTVDGEYRGKASQFAHWDYTPPQIVIFDDSARGYLDHSQVFHRVPTAARWHESIEGVKCGDGLFFDDLIRRHGPIYPIAPGVVLSQEHLFS